jgi:hypothetical protein
VLEQAGDGEEMSEGSIAMLISTITTGNLAVAIGNEVLNKPSREALIMIGIAYFVASSSPSC